MDEKDLEVLKQLSETPNITRAARELFTTQPSLTRRVQKIETDLGCRLFARSKKGLTPLPAFERLTPLLRRAAQTMEELRSFAREAAGAVCGQLKLGVSINYARYTLPPLLRRFVRDFPLVDVRLTANHSPIIFRELQRGETDVAVLRGDLPWNEGDVVLSREPVCLVRSRQNADVPLSEMPYIARESDRGIESDYSRWRAERGLLARAPKNQLTLNDSATCLALIREGLGWSLIAEICIAEADGLIVEPARFLDGTPFERATHLLYHDEAALLPQVRAFIEAAAGHAGISAE